MTYLDELGNRIRSLVEAADLPKGDTHALFRAYAVLMLAKGGNVSAADVHNAWVAWMSDREPNHASLVPFEELEAEVAAADWPFVEAIRAVAGDMRWSNPGVGDD